MPRILIIDDDKLTRTGITKLLESKQYDVLQAENGQKGLILALQEHPEVIICDVMMPGMNGYEVLQKLQENRHTAGIPFIFLTSKADVKDIRAAMLLGADDYLIKPFDEKELLDSIRSKINKRKDSQTTQTLLHHTDQNKMLLHEKSAHEINTPLSGILMSTDLLLKRQGNLNKEEEKELLHIIHSSAKRLNNTLQNYQLYNILESLKEDEELRAFYASGLTQGFKRLAEETIDQVARDYGRYNDVIVELEESTLRIAAPHAQKIVKELVENALKFSEKGQIVQVLGKKHEDLYHLKIIDYGRGMEPWQMQNITAYRQFERAKYEQQGMGLGLYLAKALIELHQGVLRLDNNPSRGTIVTVSLRIQPSH
ncbi:hybrid sensor histidine kinase/response regulator [Eisenibacter elegans]|jgi:DNA-binding response OmpR family regulator|uniref:hybrid sensor histidine kinase/response regulator n=1 Tax=Eisenibacter elegans TaxID=997 RepID=UPI000408200B|nr:hybrid sensor histidine kinase/response regulator [Eisenibacter elegans]